MFNYIGVTLDRLGSFVSRNAEWFGLVILTSLWKRGGINDDASAGAIGWKTGWVKPLRIAGQKLE